MNSRPFRASATGPLTTLRCERSVSQTPSPLPTWAFDEPPAQPAPRCLSVSWRASPRDGGRGEPTRPCTCGTERDLHLRDGTQVTKTTIEVASVPSPIGEV